MPDTISFTKTFQALENVVGLAQRRHSLIAGNISNLDTPYYREKDIDFKRALAQALGSDHEVSMVKTSPGHISSEMKTTVSGDLYEEKGEWNGVNWVNLESEIMKLTENNLKYRVATETLLRKIAILKEVIREGGR